MKFFRLDLLTLLISLFILNSCKNEDTIGLTNGTGTISGSLVDTATVFTNTTPDDTVVTSGITNVPLGFFKDPVMGTTASDMITDLNLPGGGVSTNVTYTIPTGQIYIDSAVLKLQYANGFSGDSLTSRYKVNVYQLGQRFYSTQSYYNDSPWLYNNNTLLGTATFYARPHDTLKVTSLVNGGPDTLIKVVPQVRIRIDTNFIRRYLLSNPTGEIASNLIFLNEIKGLYLTMDQNQAGAGGIMMFAAPADSALEVHIRAVNGNTIDTSVVYLNISQHAAKIIHAYTPAVIAAKNNTTTHTDSLIYLQGLASLRAKISFPYILSLFKSIGNSNVVINRAEIVLTAAPGSDIPAYLTPQPYLSLYRYDIAHQRVSVEDASTTDPRHYTNDIFGGIYSLTTRQYHFLVTSYIQDLIDGVTVDYGTFIGPIAGTNTSSVDIAATPETAGRAVVVGNAKSSSPLYPYRIRLNVIYTKTNKQ
jgi:hypothetical protein